MKLLKLSKSLCIILFLFSSNAFSSEKIVVTNTDLESVPNINGQLLNTGSGGEFKLLYFWATWCPNCKEKFNGALNEFKKVKNMDLILISTEKDSALVKNYVEKQNISDAVYLDRDKVLRKKLNIDAVPAWALVKRTTAGFEVVATDIGFDDAEVMAKIKLNLEKTN
jgi:thiol-disulfide isomerase/thioredoxin